MQPPGCARAGGTAGSHSLPVSPCGLCAASCVAFRRCWLALRPLCQRRLVCWCVEWCSSQNCQAVGADWHSSWGVCLPLGGRIGRLCCRPQQVEGAQRLLAGMQRPPFSLAASAINTARRCGAVHCASGSVCIRPLRTSAARCMLDGGAAATRRGASSHLAQWRAAAHGVAHGALAREALCRHLHDHVGRRRHGLRAFSGDMVPPWFELVAFFLPHPTRGAYVALCVCACVCVPRAAPLQPHGRGWLGVGLFVAASGCAWRCPALVGLLR